MTMLDKLKEILLANTEITNIDISEGTDLKNDLNLSSFDLAQLVFAVEEEFDVEIPDRTIRNIKTVGDVIDFLEKQ